MKNLVEYYYMWKTTDRYVQQKRVKAVESEQKLKQVYVPDYSKIGAGSGLVRGLRDAYEFAADKLHVVKNICTYQKIFAGDGALPAAACVGAVCVCCRTTTAAAWYEVPGAELAGMPQVTIK